MLDFGCGAGRTLRHFSEEAQACEVWGSDIHEASIAWLDDHLCPPMQVFTNGAEPPLPHPDGTFDLIWAVSVFTHLTDAWSSWLVELHRVLADDGLIYVTFMGSGMSEPIAGERWEESRYGMNVLRSGQSWDLGGPMVLHSPWWIRAHWGRAFEIVTLKPDGFAGDPGEGHGAVLMCKRQVDITPAELEAIEPGEPREATALTHNVSRLRDEVAELRRSNEVQVGDLRRFEVQVEELEALTGNLQRQVEAMAASKSWVWTHPLRVTARAVRSRRR